MKLLLTVLTLLSALVIAVPLHAASPFTPEEDARFRKLEAERVLYFTYDFAINTGSSAAAINLGPATNALPANAYIIRNYFFTQTPITSAVGSPTVAFACGSANLYTAGSGFNGGANTFVDGVATGASTAFSASVGTTPCRPKITLTVQPATAGKVRGYIRYIVPTKGALEPQQ